MIREKIKKEKQAKVPSLLRKVINVYYEQALKNKALRTLEKQAWSIDFLSMVLSRAAKQAGTNLSMDIINANGTKLVVTALARPVKNSTDDNDDIFNHLDDSKAVSDFINAHRRV